MVDVYKPLDGPERVSFQSGMVPSSSSWVT